VRAAALRLTQLGPHLHQLGSGELAVVVEELDELARRVEAATVAVVIEAESRGVVAESSATNNSD